MSERRRYKRVDLDVAIKGRLVDPHKKFDITADIPLRAKNLSEGGALLEWPRSWNCDICSNCLGWVHNLNCKLKEKEERGAEFNKELVPEMRVTVQLLPGSGIEPVTVSAKVNWVKSSQEESRDKYEVGVSFMESEKQEPDIKKKILVIKKNFEVSSLKDK